MVTVRLRFPGFSRATQVIGCQTLATKMSDREDNNQIIPRSSSESRAEQNGERSQFEHPTKFGDRDGVHHADRRKDHLQSVLPKELASVHTIYVSLRLKNRQTTKTNRQKSFKKIK